MRGIRFYRLVNGKLKVKQFAIRSRMSSVFFIFFSVNYNIYVGFNNSYSGNNPRRA